MSWVEPTPDELARMGALCRCLSCCCRPGEGHRSKAYREWMARMEAHEDGRGSGASAGGD